MRLNIDVALRYMEAWLKGNGAVGIHNLMEDAATAEISRAQLWQWIRHRAPLEGDGAMNPDVYCRIREEVVAELREGREGTDRCFEEAVKLLDELVLGDEFASFLTLPAYGLLD